MKETLSFKKELEQVWLANGFKRQGKSYCRADANITALVNIEKGFDNQWFVNVGFWLMMLDTKVPDRVEKAHMYFRLEGLFPEYKETILAAGALSDTEQSRSFKTFLKLLSGPIDNSLRELQTVEGLRAALISQRLLRGLVTKEARQYLESNHCKEL